MTSQARVWFLAGAAAAWLAVTAVVFIGRAADTNPPVTIEQQAISEAVSALSGIWKLKTRTNPDGTEYAKPLDGTTTISLSTLQHSNLLGPRAIGRIHSEESGVIDGRFGPYVKEAIGKPFHVESDGTWIVTAFQMSSETIVSVKQTSIFRSDYYPFDKGISMPVEARYRVERKAGGGAPSFQLVKAIPGPVFDLAGNALDEKRLEIGYGVASIFFDGRDEMRIMWTPGGRDVWKKTGPTRALALQ